MKCFMIGMKDNEISRKYMEITIPHTEDILGCKVQILDAILPDDSIIDHNKFSKIKTKTYGTTGKPFSSTEKAIWYSHLKAWDIILKNENESIWILEHDAIIDKPPVFENNTCAIFANNPGCAVAYCMKPYLVRRLKETFDTIKSMDMQVDTFMDWWFYFHNESKRLCKIVKAEQLTQFGTTITHL